MASVIPSPIGRAIESLGEGIFHDIEMRRRFQLMERQVSVQEREAERMERQQSWQELSALMGMGEPGSAVADLPWTHEHFRRLFPDADPADVEGLGGWKPNPQTMPFLVDTLLQRTLQEMPEDARNRLMQTAMGPAVMRAAAGTAETPEEVKLRGEEAGAWITALEYYHPSPEDFQRMALERFGLATIDFTDPKTGEEYSFDNSVAAELFVRILLQQRQLGFMWWQTGQQAGPDMEAEFLSQLEKAGIVIPRRIVGRLFAAAHGTQEDVAQFVATYGDSPDVIAAMNIYLHGVSIAEESIFDVLSQLPGGQEMSHTLRLLSSVSDAIGKEATADIAKGLLKRWREVGWPVAPLQGRREFNRLFDNLEAAGGRLHDPREAAHMQNIERLFGSIGITPDMLTATTAPPDRAVMSADVLSRLSSGELQIPRDNHILMQAGFTPQDILILRDALRELQGITGGR